MVLNYLEKNKINNPHRYLHIITKKLGYNIIQFNVIDRNRYGGKSKYNLNLKIVSFIKDSLILLKYINNKN